MKGCLICQRELCVVGHWIVTSRLLWTMMLVIKKKKIQFAVIPTPPPIRPSCKHLGSPGFKLERSPGSVELAETRRCSHPRGRHSWTRTLMDPLKKQAKSNYRKGGGFACPGSFWAVRERDHLGRPLTKISWCLSTLPHSPALGWARSSPWETSMLILVAP